MSANQPDGRRRLDQTQRARTRAWSDATRDRMEDRALTQTDLASKINVARSTFISWLKGETPPDPWRLSRLAEELSFPVDEQLALLGWRGLSEAATPQGARPVELLAQLKRSIAELEQASARVADLTDGAGDVVGTPAARFVDAVLATGGDRWQMLTWRLRDGDRYPLLRETMVEFGLRAGIEPLTWDELSAQHRTYLGERAPVMYARDTADEPARDQIKRERLELRALIDTADDSRSLDGTFFGEAGCRWESICSLTRSLDGQRWSHLLALNEHPLAPADDPLLVNCGSTRLLLIVAPTYMTGRVVGRLVANALRWRDVSHERLTTLEWGRPRDGVAGERVRQLRTTLRRWLISPPTIPTVMSVIRHHALVDAEGGDGTESRSIANLAASNPALTTVLVRPGEVVLRAWEDQQIDNSRFSGLPTLGTADQMRDVSNKVREAFGAARHQPLELRFELPAIESVSSSNFRDSRISDEQVRLAYRVCKQLGVTPDETSDLGRLVHLLKNDTEI